MIWKWLWKINVSRISENGVPSHLEASWTLKESQNKSLKNLQGELNPTESEKIF